MGLLSGGVGRADRARQARILTEEESVSGRRTPRRGLRCRHKTVFKRSRPGPFESFGAQSVNNLQKASSDADAKTVNNYRGFGFTSAARGWGLMAGVDAPVAGGKAMFAVGYSHLDADKGDEKQTNSYAEFERVGASVGYTYAFSKRTNVYGVAAYYQDTHTNTAGENEKPQTTMVTVGVRHTF